MFSLIKDWSQSGLTQRAFCEQHKIVPHVFSYWYKCYRKHNDVQPTKKFIELQSPNIQGEAAIEVLLSCGHRIYFNQPVAASFIKELVS